MVLDGGQCGFGIESSVTKITSCEKVGLKVEILRRGGVSEEKLQGLLES